MYRIVGWWQKFFGIGCNPLNKSDDIVVIEDLQVYNNNSFSQPSNTSDVTCKYIFLNIQGMVDKSDSLEVNAVEEN